jgi:hypothetical protein
MLRTIIVAFATLLAVFDANASCYIMLGYGQAKVNEDKIRTTNIEERIIELPFVEGHIRKNGKSTPYTFGGGCQVFRYMWLELSYRDHVEATVSSSYWLEGFGKKSESVSAIRTLEVHGPVLAAVFEIPISGPLSVIAKAGAMRGTGYLSMFLPEISTEYAITKKEERILPVGGAGILLRITKHVSLAVEHEQYNNNFRYTSANFRYRF